MNEDIRHLLARVAPSQPITWRPDGLVLSAHLAPSPGGGMELLVLAELTTPAHASRALLSEPAVLEDGVQVGFWHRAPSALRRPLRCLWAYASELRARSIEIVLDTSVFGLDLGNYRDMAVAPLSLAGPIVTGANTSFIRLSTDIDPAKGDVPHPIQVDSPDAELLGLWHFGARGGRALSVVAFEGEHDQLQLSLRNL